MNPNIGKIYLFMLLIFFFIIKITFTTTMLLVDIYKIK